MSENLSPVLYIFCGIQFDRQRLGGLTQKSLYFPFLLIKRVQFVKLYKILNCEWFDSVRLNLRCLLEPNLGVGPS